MALEYVAFTFFACVAVLQFVAARNDLRGLSFFRSRRAVYVFSGLVLSSSFAWFFLSEDRARPGLEGLQQFLLFGVAAVMAVAVTFLLSSLLNGRRLGSPHQNLTGLDALRETTFLRALRSALKEGDGDS